MNSILSEFNLLGEQLPLTLTVEEVAKIMRISKASAYELVKRTDFPSVRVGRRICIPRDAFLRWYGLTA